MTQTLFYLVSSFWLGALHAATPGHGKTIAAAYIVSARGRSADALALGVFVTLAHTAGIVLVAALASLGAAWSVPARIEAYLALAAGLLVVGIGLWMVKGPAAALLATAPGHASAYAGSGRGAGESVPSAHRTQGHDHSWAHLHEGHLHHRTHHHDHRDHRQTGGHLRAPSRALEEGRAHPAAGYHRHGWGPAHTHRLDAVAGRNMSWPLLLGLGVAGGLLPDPGALAILLAAIASGKLVTGLCTVLVFSLGFASVLVAVGLLAARVGHLVLAWMSSRWMLWLQLGTAVLIFGVGIVLTLNAWRALQALA